MYRLFGIDIGTKEGWDGISSDTSSYHEGQWLSLNVNDIPDSTVNFDDMLAEFEGEVDKSALRLFGHCIYKLVATRDNQWKSEMKDYRLLS